MKSSILLIIFAVLALSACSRTATETEDPAPTEAARPATTRPAIDAQTVKPPCEWLTIAEVAEVFGPVGQPQRAGDAENWGADESGEACAYPVTTEFGPANLVLQVDLAGAPGFESASNLMADIIARELPPELTAEAPPVKKSPEGWDYVGWIAGMRLYRLGHVAIVMNFTNNRAKDELLDRVALLVRGKIADKPFKTSQNDANFMESSSDPCDLITQAEAEAVLGRLTTAPYRSLKAAPVAHEEGTSCTYYTSGHRTFTIKPDYFDGKEHFGMVAGLGSLVRSNLGGADAGDLLDGPWDSASQGSSGRVFFLQGDTFLEVSYRTSATDIEGAAKLAAIAMPRAVKVGSGEEK